MTHEEHNIQCNAQPPVEEMPAFDMEAVQRDNARLNQAIIFATERHAGQLRKGTALPYILHPLETLQILSEMQADMTDLTNLGYSRSSNNYHYWTDSAGNRHSITPNSDNYSTVSGEVKHTLTTAEMPSHYHYVGAGANDATGYHASGSKVGHIGIWNATGYGRNSDSSGGGGAHNNMPPYYVVYIYKRVS